MRVWVHIADVAAHVPPRLRRRPRGLPARDQRLRAGQGRADAARGALQRGLLARAAPGPPRGHGRARLRRRRGRPQRLPPLADPLGRAPGLPAGGPHLRGRRARRGALGGAARRGPRGRRGARCGAGRARRARGRVRRAGVRLLARGARDGARAERADRVAPADRAPDDRRQRGGRRRCSSRASCPALYRVHERPEPARVEHLVAQLAALDVPTPPLPETMSPQQAGERRRGDLAAGRRARAPHRPRPRGAHLARAALAQAGALLGPQRRPPRPAVAALLPLHVADPALPRPDLPPRAAGGDRRGGGAARRRGDGGARRSGARCASATPPRSSARPTTSRAASCSRRELFERGWETRVARAR